MEVKMIRLGLIRELMLFQSFCPKWFCFLFYDKTILGHDDCQLFSKSENGEGGLIIQADNLTPEFQYDIFLF
jgi:hypothetical protein